MSSSVVIGVDAGLREATLDDQMVAFRSLTDRRRDLTQSRTQAVNRSRAPRNGADNVDLDIEPTSVRQNLRHVVFAVQGVVGPA